MVGGYKTKGSAVTIPPNSLTYSDTGMFMDPDDSKKTLTLESNPTIINLIRQMVPHDKR